jgi:hypothetical protein
MILELYLAVPGFANRKYVVERLQGKQCHVFGRLPVSVQYVFKVNVLTVARMTLCNY